MIRTKLDDRVLPQYTRGEELMNTLTHCLGAIFSIVVIILCVNFSKDRYGLFSGVVYGVSMFLVYTMSATYHGLSPQLKAKKVFQVLDHCSIYLLIAGTYTPVLLCAIRKIDAFWAWALFGIIWLMTIIGITCNAIDLKRFEKFSMCCYLMMGWCIIFKINLLPPAVTTTGVLLLVGGGIAYTIGVIFYKLQKHKQYMHGIWHIMILVGSALHFVCILLFCV